MTPANDVDALAAALQRARSRPPARLSVDLAEFHVDHVTEALLDLYDRLRAATAATPVAERVSVRHAPGVRGRTA